jgi:bifunctional UDP-N-acetylglucosamine pyrophosphorylase/glucosamine-1-phosphate N-acetyltransferase
MAETMPGNAAALILAAGKGTRMRSEKPKVLQTLLGEPMLAYVYAALHPLFGENVLTVVGWKSEMVCAEFPKHEAGCVLQEQQLGTGHAVQTAWPELSKRKAESCLIVNGDTPLLSTDKLQKLIDAFTEESADIAFITLTLPDPKSFGRVVRNAEGGIAAIVEAKDYKDEVHGAPTGEINSGIYMLKSETMGPMLSRLSDDNAGGEYYITDLVGFAVAEGLKVLGVECGNDPYLLGVNSPKELAEAEELLRARIVDEHLDRGVVIHDAKNVSIGPDVELNPDVEITGPVRIMGKTVAGKGVVIHSNTWICDSTLDEGAEVFAFSHVQSAHIGPHAKAGPYARLRPGAQLQEKSKVGNFVEMKKAVLGPGAKASHLTYLGDATVGPEANIGAGTITCNYDGKNKHSTVIGEGAFIGSNTALVAPVTVGKNALIGAGSVITKDVDDEHLALTRAQQKQYLRKK